MRKELEPAFRRARYRVLAPSGEMILWVDRHEPALQSLLQATRANSAALLTAFNPDGRRAAPFRNRQAQRRLQAGLDRRGFDVIPCRNEDPRGHWPVEPSLLVPGLPLVEARQIAVRYGQAAFLWTDGSGTPRLIAAAAARSGKA